MKERPILFQGEMVRALLEGTKIQTRRIVKNQVPDWDHFSIENDTTNAEFFMVCGKEDPARPGLRPILTSVTCPYGQPGDRLWVRESWCVAKQHDKTKPIDLPYEKGLTTFYEAGGSRARQEVGGPYVNDDAYPHPCMPDWVGKGRPSIHMPRAASRIQLEIVSVRVERLRAITLGDICNEGLAKSIYDFKPAMDGFRVWTELWESINGAGSWDDNPWVWVVEFKRVQP